MLVGRPVACPHQQGGTFDPNSGAASTWRKVRATRPFAGEHVIFQKKTIDNLLFMVPETFELNQLIFAPSQLLPDFLGFDRNKEFFAFELVANLVWFGFVAG